MARNDLEQSYDHFERIEEEFQNALDESLRPRGPDLLFDIVAGLNLPTGASVLDVGCGRGEQSLELARRFGFAVMGIDPVSRQTELAEGVAATEPGLAKLLRFERASAEALPLPDESIDLIWCRESFYFFDLDRALEEWKRVLRPGGRVLIYYNPAGDRLEPREAAWLWERTGSTPTNADVAYVEAAFTNASFAIEQLHDIRSEFGEYGQEAKGVPGQRLLHAARLLRDPERYVVRFGQANYDIMLGDCFWHIFRMIGKLTSRIYVLSMNATK